MNFYYHLNDQAINNASMSVHYDRADLIKNPPTALLERNTNIERMELPNGYYLLKFTPKVPTEPPRVRWSKIGSNDNWTVIDHESKISRIKAFLKRLIKSNEQKKN